MRVLDLFSGIGGFSLGLERAGMQTVAFCEINPYCRDVLRAHWPDVPIHEDITALRGSDVGPVDVICGGFPCQDISGAGKGAGIKGERSGLWKQFARIIGEIRPKFVIVENVSMLRSRGMGVVLGDLASLGYDAEWHCIPASAVNAPPRRDRVWIVANARRECGATRRTSFDMVSQAGTCEASGEEWKRDGDASHNSCATLANAEIIPERKQTKENDTVSGRRKIRAIISSDGKPLAYANGKSILGATIARTERAPWDTEPEMGRVVNGVSHRMVEDELKALGNAVVPQIPEMIGRAIMCAAGLN
jgi:DNA (cytosine-5)-methyltransferase 1